MAVQRVVLHIGTMKAGSTFLQTVLQADRSRLHEVGVDTIAGAGKDAVGGGRPHGAARRLVRSPSGAGPWDRIVDAVHRSPHETVVISSELLSFISPEAVDLVTGSFPDLEVTAVLVVRDQLTAIPAQWQSFTRNRGQASFPTYVRQIAGPDRTRSFRSFQRAQDVTGILDRWDRGGLDRLVVVTAPPSGSPPELLWQRFREAAVIAPHEVTLEGPEVNPSLGYAACDYLRRLNKHFEDVPKPRYRRLLRPMATEALAPLRGVQGRPRLDRATGLLAQQRNQDIRDAIAERGLELVGSVEDLPVGIDAASFPDEVATPDLAQVRESSARALEYAARRAGVDVPTPDSLPEQLAVTAKLLRRRRKRKRRLSPESP